MKNNYKFWVVFSFIVVFVAGAIGGILLEKHLLSEKPRRTERSRSSVHFPTIEMMAEELILTAGQQEKIKSFFENNEERFKGLRGHMRERLSSIRKQLIIDIKSVLSEEQTLKFETMIEKYLSQRRRENEIRKNRSRKPKKDNGEKR